MTSIRYTKENRYFKDILLRPSLFQVLVEHWFLSLLSFSGFFIGFLSDYAYHAEIALGGCICWFLLMYNALFLYSFKVKVTDDQMIITKGPFITKVDYIELYRIFDYSLEQSILQKFFGIKTLYIFSGDKTCPKLKIAGIHSVDAIVCEIRSRVEFNKKNKGIYEVTNR